MRALTVRSARRFVTLVVVVAALAVPTIATSGPAAAENGGAFTVAACVLTLSVDFGPPVGLVPSAAAMTVNGGGTCVMNSSVVPFFLGGTLYALSNKVGCAIGSASGLLTMYAPSVFPGEDAVTATFVNTGGVWTALFSKVGFSIVAGAGVFVQGVAADTACASTSGRVSHTTLIGGMVLLDPAVPAVP